MAWEKAGDAAKRVAARQRPDDDDDDTPPSGGGGAALQGLPPEFESDRDDRSDRGREPHAPRSWIGRTPMAQGPRSDGPSDAPAADRGRAIGRWLPIEGTLAGRLAHRLASTAVEHRWRAARRARLNEDLAVAEGPASSVSPRQALAAGREAGRQLGA